VHEPSGARTANRTDTGSRPNLLKIAQSVTFFPGGKLTPKDFLAVYTNSMKTAAKCTEAEMVTNFVHSMKGEAQVWLSGVNGWEDMDWATLQATFLSNYGDEVRSPSVVAINKLLTGAHRMQPRSEDLPEYTRRFRRLLNDCIADLTPKMQCQAFLVGLPAVLRSACLTDQHGKDWTDLRTLIDFVILQEKKMTLAGTWQKSGRSAAAAVQGKGKGAATPGKRDRESSDMDTADDGFQLAATSSATALRGSGALNTPASPRGSCAAPQGVY
jgi:hypothetical protein